VRIIWLCHYFAPEIGAPQARLLELGRVFRDAGHSVGVVTCFPNHPTGKLRPEDGGIWWRRDEIDGIDVHRCWSLVTAGRGFVSTTLGHLSFMLTSIRGLTRAAVEQRPDVVIVSSPTFFSVVSAWWWCRRHRVPYVFEVRDLWPAIFVDLGVLRSRALIGLLERLELFLYRRAARVVTVTHSFADDIAARGIPREKLGVITNGVDVERFKPGERDEQMAHQHALQGRFVVLYLGAHGISQALSCLLDVAEQLGDLDDIRLVFVGEGAEREKLVRSAAERGLSNVSFHAGVPKDEVSRWYDLADIGLVPLRDVELFKAFIPSKMFELMASGIPIVASVRGEAREILEASGGARVVDPEDAVAMARQIRELHADPALGARLATSGRAFVERQYTRRQLGHAYLDILEETIQGEAYGAARGG
jgi:glycosyltransferase involved in cell wall biosynthesis